MVQSFGGGLAGRHPYLKMEFIKGCSLDKMFKTKLTDDEILHRIAQIAYLANTISQLHYYQVIHKDLKPKNLLLCQNPLHKNNHKILICDFGYAQAKLRETVNEYGGQLTPCYSAPEQAIMGENLSASVDYFSFGIIVHEYLTGEPLFPHSMDIFIEDGYRITDRYLEYLKTDERLRVVALLDLIHPLHSLCIGGITADAPHGVRRVEDHPTPPHRLQGILDVLFACHLESKLIADSNLEDLILGSSHRFPY